jgi:hypothetical protein
MSTLKLGKHIGPRRQYLGNLLPPIGITSRRGLSDYISNNYKKDEDLPFKIFREEDLGLDGEGRLYDDEVDFENVIVDVPLLNLQNSCEIRLVNCLFTGELWVGQKRADFESIYFDHCIISKKLLCVSLKHANIDLLRVNAPEVHINLLEHAKKFSIVECHFGDFCLQRSSAKEFFTYLNQFEQLEITNCEFGKTIFDHRQVPMLLGTQPPDIFNEFEFTTTVDWGDEIEIESSATIASTMRFILDKSNINLDRDALANAKYRAALASKRNAWGRFVIQLFGAFIKPKRILLLMVAGIIGFALVYMFPWFHFNADKTIKCGLGFYEAIYYSGVTFATIGYGDITPVGLARLLAVLEGLAGVTLMSAFLVALTRKYVD